MTQKRTRPAINAHKRHKRKLNGIHNFLLLSFLLSTFVAKARSHSRTHLSLLHSGSSEPKPVMHQLDLFAAPLASRGGATVSPLHILTQGRGLSDLSYRNWSSASPEMIHCLLLVLARSAPLLTGPLHSSEAAYPLCRPYYTKNSGSGSKKRGSSSTGM